MEEDLQGGGDNIVTEFATYEDFLDSQVLRERANELSYDLWRGNLDGCHDLQATSCC